MPGSRRRLVLAESEQRGGGESGAETGRKAAAAAAGDAAEKKPRLRRSTLERTGGLSFRFELSQPNGRSGRQRIGPNLLEASASLQPTVFVVFLFRFFEPDRHRLTLV